MRRSESSSIDQTLVEDTADNLPDDDELEGGVGLIELRLEPEDGGERLDKVLARLLPQYSRSRLQQWIEGGHVTVDGKPARAKAAMCGDETIAVNPQPAQEDQAFKPEPMALDIVHEDAAIIVIDKPAGLVVHPAAGNWSGTLLNGLLHHCPQLGGVPRAGIVHRLDKDTSGVMVAAKTLEAQTDLVRQLQARSVKREYLALVWGKPVAAGKIDTLIGRHPRDRLKMAVVSGLQGKPAVTYYERLAVGKLEGREVSLVHCRLETGRTHQIRVHMQSLGFPLVGDALYGKAHLAAVFRRQALQAYRLGLIHPLTGQACEWRVPVASDLAGLIESAGIALPD